MELCTVVFMELSTWRNTGDLLLQNAAGTDTETGDADETK